MFDPKTKQRHLGEAGNNLPLRFSLLLSCAASLTRVNIHASVHPPSQLDEARADKVSRPERSSSPPPHTKETTATTQRISLRVSINPYTFRNPDTIYLHLMAAARVVANFRRNTPAAASQPPRSPFIAR